MKKIIALCAIVSASSAFATSELEFGDLNYFLKQSQFNLTENARYMNSRYKLKTGGSTSSFEREGYKSLTTLGVGLTDQLNLYAGLNYDFQYDTTAGSSRRFNQDGLNNPILGGNLRLINQKDASVNVDIGAVARVNLQQAETGATSGSGNARVKNGNGADGRSSYEINAALGRKWNEANEWRVSGGYLLNTDGDRDQLLTTGGKRNFKMDSSNDFYLMAAYQYRPVQEFMLNVSAKAIRIGEFTEKGAGVKTKNDDHMRYDFLFNARYLVTESFIVDWNFAQSRIPDFNTKTGGTKSKYHDNIAGYMSLGVSLLF